MLPFLISIFRLFETSFVFLDTFDECILSCFLKKSLFNNRGYEKMSSLNVLLLLLPATLAQVPSWPSSWRMNDSTIAMICNYSGYQDPQLTPPFALLDFDWSNALALWSASTPMDTNERLLVQAGLTSAANPATKSWIYRNSAYAYPWYNTVRFILDDEDYSPWFLKFKPNPPWYSPKCDVNYDPPKCTEYFHTQMDTPLPQGKGGYGACTGSACNCGSKPCGFYVFNHSSDAVINGQTFQQWFIDSYMLDSIGMSPDVSGFFWDDFWSDSGNMGDNTKNATEDMGLTNADLIQLTNSYTANMATLVNRTLSAGKFSWQMLYTGGDPDSKGSTCPGPIIQKGSCSATFRSLCTEGSPAQTRTLMYGLSPGFCTGNPANLTDFDNDLASFLLIRGEYGYIGHGWLGCSRTYDFPPELSVDYGIPTGLCSETAENSEVFTRDYSKSTITFNCTSWTSSIVMK